MAKLTVKDLEVRGKRVLTRVDYNVPLEEKDGRMVINDVTRIRETLATLELLIEKGARIILLAHLGRPRGRREPSLSLRPVAAKLADMIHRPIAFVDDCIGEKVEQTADALKPGDILLLENVRYYGEEEANDAAFAGKLAKVADVYVNDAFGAAHRAHASTEGVARVVAGRGEVSDKINVIDRLLERADTLLIGGAMTYTFRLALGRKVGKSLVEPDRVSVAQAALEKAKARKVQLLLAMDNIVATPVETGQLNKKGRPIVEWRNPRVNDSPDIPDAEEGMDIGPKTIRTFIEIIPRAKTILWNGPMGVFEDKRFAEGTFAVARAVADATQKGAQSIVGGGDSVKALNLTGRTGQVTFVSTGGGASLEFLEGKVLPGVAALTDQ